MELAYKAKMAGRCHFSWKEPFREISFPVENKFTYKSLTRAGLAVSSNYIDADVHDGIATEDLRAEHNAFVASLRACAKRRDLYTGIRLHAALLKRGFLEKSSFVADALVCMYAKCGALAKAQELHNGLRVRDVFSWTALISGYAQQGQGHEALICFEKMQSEDIAPDAVTFISMLNACGSIGAADKGRQIHDEIAQKGLLDNNVVLGTALVDMYAKCGALEKAQKVLEEIHARDIISWNALIGGYAQQGQGQDALNCLAQMQREGISPNAVTFTCILNACSSIGAIDKGEKIHDEIARQGLLGNNIVLGNALLDMYAKCGALAKAERVLEELPVQNAISWNALIAGYAQQGQGQDALTCFEKMRCKGLRPNSVTFICILKACGSIGASDKGEEIHDEIVKQGLLGKDIVLGTALVDMYAKCGALAKAQQVLDELPARDVVSWSALIAGYAQQGQGAKAFGCYERMHHEGLSPNAVTFICILKACGSIGATDKGEQIHDEIVRQGLLENNVVLGTALVDMYVKCGVLSKAQQVLEELPVRSVNTWNVLIAEYVQQGKGHDALNCFERMQQEGLSPEAVTYTCILKACGIVGAADKGEQIHDEIFQQGLLGNDVVLGTALVDMYCKCGALAKARGVLEELPVGDVISWNALIAGYAQQGQGKNALNCFARMHQKGLTPDTVTFSCVLNACRHSGLLEEGQMFFANMSLKYGIKPDLEHYTCMVDLLAHSGHLNKAVATIKNMPSLDFSAVWYVLLGACRKWGDVKVGRWAFEQAIQADKSVAAPYVCMAAIYAAAGMPEDEKNIEAMRLNNKAWKKLEGMR